MKNRLCVICNVKEITLRNLYCTNCYCYGIRDGTIARIVKPELPSGLTQLQEDVLIGSLLGDGCVFRYKPTHKPHLAIGRQLLDENYLIWEYKIFADFCSSKYKKYSIYDNRTDKTYYGIKFATRRAQVFEKYYTNWYPDGKKIIPSDLKLNPQILAIWFCDDGNVSPANSPWRMHLKLSTHGFPKDGTQFLIDTLTKRYGEKFHIIKDSGNYYIIASDNATRPFLAEIDGYMPEQMLRKMYWRKPEARFYDNIPERARDHIKNHTNNITLIEKDILTQLLNSNGEWLTATRIAINLNIYYSDEPGTSKIINHLKKFLRLGWVEKQGTWRGKIRTQYKLSNIGIDILKNAK